MVPLPNYCIPQSFQMEASKTFSAEEINQQIARVLDFPRFKNSRILSGFLQFIVEETIQQRELHIKEYSVAINVLHRCRNFNPHDDAIVRIHAGRLRRALEDYYLTQGLHDPIFIKIPKGSYVPQFSKGIVDIFKHRESPDL